MDENNNTNETENIEKDTSTKTSEAPASTYQRPENNVLNSENNYVPTYHSTPSSSSDSSENAANISGSYTQSYNYSSPTDSTSEAPQTSQGFAIASLVLGILSIVCCCCGFGILCGIVGIILGCVQEKDAYGKKPTMAVVGIILSAIGLLLSVIMVIAFVAYSASLSTTDIF